MNESDYNKWRPYEVGKDYWSSNLIGKGHPNNTCSYKTEDGYPVLVVLNTGKILDRRRIDDNGRPCYDNLYHLSGFDVTVWRPKPGIPITSLSVTVDSLDDIDAAVELLKGLVDDACLHKDSEILINSPTGEHKFRCNECGKIWGYDSSG